MPDRARPSPPNSVPDLKKRPHGKAGHVGQIRLSDWLKFEILQSDWSGPKPTPCTTFMDFSQQYYKKLHVNLYLWHL